MVGYIHPSLRAFDLSQFSMPRPLTSPQESPPRPTAEVGLARLRVAGSTLLLAVGWAVTTTCASYQLYSDCVTPSSPCPDQGSQDQDAVLFLVGDAGSEEFESNPVLQHMKTAVTALDRRGVPATVVFLGDNVYEEGVRDGHPEDLRLLAGQVEVVAGTSAKGIFLPGNHDWGNTADDRGLERLMNQEQALAVFSGNGANVDLMPRAGCPGPERENLEDSRGDVLAALVLLDTPWWLLEAPGNSRCSTSTKEDVIREMERVLSEASGLPVIVAGHHPLQSGGPHAGNDSGLRWLGHRLGFMRDDLNSPQYRALIDGLSEAFGRGPPPVIYVAGHDHSLQVIEKSEEGASVFYLVSGSGSKVTGAGPIAGSRFAAGLPGYMRVDFRSGGRIQLSVVAQCSVEAVDANLCRGVDAGRFQSVYRARIR